MDKYDVFDDHLGGTVGGIRMPHALTVASGGEVP